MKSPSPQKDDGHGLIRTSENPWSIYRMLFHICSSKTNRVIQILSKQAIRLSDISEYLLKNDTTNISDFLETGFSLLQHFGYISGTKSSLHFFLFTQNPHSHYEDFYYFFRIFTNVSLGIDTFPNCFIFFFPSFCFSRSLRFRVISPP